MPFSGVLSCHLSVVTNRSKGKDFHLEEGWKYVVQAWTSHRCCEPGVSLLGLFIFMVDKKRVSMSSELQVVSSSSS